MKHLGLKGVNLNWINKTCAIGGKLLWERCYQNKQVESCSHYEAVVLNTLGHLFCEFWLWIEKAHVQSIKFGIEWHLFGRWLRCICICIFMENWKAWLSWNMDCGNIWIVSCLTIWCLWNDWDEKFWKCQGLVFLIWEKAEKHVWYVLLMKILVLQA